MDEVDRLTARHIYSERSVLSTRFGLLLPHFGQAASVDRVVRGAPRFEEWGFSSVFVRDNLMFRGHGFEPPGTTMMDPFTTLAAITTCTKRLVIGLATLVPIRNPLVASQLIGGLSNLAGPGRLIVGIGAGGQRDSFEALNIDWERRTDLVREYVEVLRNTWSGDRVTHHGEFFHYEDVTIDPRPPEDTPIWYGGSTPASVRRAVEYCDGWFPGRCPLRTLDRRLDDLRTRAAAEDKHVDTGIVPIVSIGQNRDEALEAVNAGGLLEMARTQRFWDGPFDTPDDLEGMLLAGTPAEVATAANNLADRGLDQIVFDLRMRPAEFDSQVTLLAEEVLPAVDRMVAGDDR